MAEAEITFSQYATAYYEIIEDGKGGKAEFVKELLKIGLSSNGKEIIDSIFPTITNSKGSCFIEKNKADRLRKYLRGDNGIGDIACELEANFDKESCVEELLGVIEDYDESKSIKFAKEINLDVNKYGIHEEDDFCEIDDIYGMAEDITELYFSIIRAAATQKVTKSNKLKNASKSDVNNIIYSYTITESEKKALINLCELIKSTLKDLERQTDTIYNKQHELKNLTDSEKDNRWKSYLENDINSLKEHFDTAYPKIERLCAKITELLEPKKDMNAWFEAMLTIASDISRDEYKITCPKKFKYRAFCLMVSKFSNNIDRVRRVIDNL